ncbi:hypothetical protein MGALJ_60760 (plasmid) [Mycobacterium gallinarum]|uniref:Uncharacterized protein n=1 Tax=Mycobacterium gallinarum TaxID=39689 RepID=A0A9W4BLM9_9MYCO|nr:hypothetical protein MGALJ_60760 [Mycobacterium gallinarum]
MHAHRAMPGSSGGERRDDGVGVASLQCESELAMADEVCSPNMPGQQVGQKWRAIQRAPGTIDQSLQSGPKRSGDDSARTEMWSAP